MAVQQLEMDSPSKAPPTTLEPVPAGPQLYAHSFFDAELKETRKLLIGSLVLPIIYLSICMWAVLSIFWGSTLFTSLSKLTVHVTNLDDGSFGGEVLAAIDASVSAGGNNLNWVFDHGVGTDQASRAIVMNEDAWAVVQVNANVLSNLDSALNTGSRYNASSAVTIYFASARNQITTNSKVLPAILAVTSPVLGRLGAGHTQEFLKTNTDNASAIQKALGCPSCLAGPFQAIQVDLIPFDVPTASAPTMVGMIFLLTFAFSLFQILYVTGNIIGPKLRVRDAIIARIGISLAAYLIMSLWYTLINLAFGIPMDRVFGRAGFLVYWMLNAFTMAALGMPQESLCTLIGQKWAGYFLSFWIIVNVSGSFASFELMPSFYSYGAGFPFFNSIQGARTIMFGTRNHLGQNFGVLIAWTAAGIIGVALFTALTLNRNKKVGKHSI